MSDLQFTQLLLREIEERAEEFEEMIEPLSAGQLWFSDAVVVNSVGNLARHITGNLNHFLGAGLLQNGYVRNREQEFTETGLAKTQVLTDLKVAVGVARQSLTTLDTAAVNQPYRTPDGVEFDSLGYHLLRLVTHFAHHHGQASYAVRYLANKV